MCDDAPQFNRLAKHHALCWIHEGRHYKKLNPIVAAHRQSLDAFIEKLWDYYHNLLEYKLNPSDKQALRLSAEFDALFSTVTGYDGLDERLAKTLAKPPKN